jgi:hypothetical protein
MNLRLPGTCLHLADEDRRVAERITALERVSKDTNSLWADPRAAALLFFYRIVLNTLGKLSMVVRDR